MTKKRGHQKFLGDRRIFLGEMQNFFREMPKKGRSKISSKIWPPFSEGLDPLVATDRLIQTYASSDTSTQTRRTNPPTHTKIHIDGHLLSPQRQNADIKRQHDTHRHTNDLRNRQANKRRQHR